MTKNQSTDTAVAQSPHRARANHILNEVWGGGFVTGLILLAAVWACIEFGLVPAAAVGPVAALTLLAAVSATMFGAMRKALAQNVWLAAAVIALLSGGVLGLDAAVGIPFGRMQYMDSAGPRIVGLVPWTMPLLSVVVVLNARGVARLIMRPWRKARNYGFWVMGIAACLAALFDLGLEPFASRINRFWVWQTRPNLPTWYGAPLVSLFGWAMTTLLVLGFATPVLINKRAGVSPHHGPVYAPLIIWIVVNGLFGLAACAHGLWLAAAVIAAGNLVVMVLAVRGATW